MRSRIWAGPSGAFTGAPPRPSAHLRLLSLKSRNILVSVPSSPASKILRTPSSTRRSTTATHRTGESIWFRNASRTSSAVVNTAPFVAPTIGITGSSNSTPPRSSSISRAAPAMSGEWKAPDTSSFTFRPLTRSATSSSASFCPEMTVWRGVLKFAATTIPSGFFGSACHAIRLGADQGDHPPRVLC